MFFYETPPLDCFEGLTPIDKAADLFMFGMCGLVQLAMNAARASLVCKSSWEGDIRTKEMYFFALPDPENNTTRPGVIWKQDNNGTTFIFSPVELPWLEEYQLNKGAS